MGFRRASSLVVGRGWLAVATGVAVGLSGLAVGDATAFAPAVPAAQLAVHPNHFTSKPAGSTSSSTGWASSNWSGYAATSSIPYTSVTGHWAVPSVQPSSGGTYSAAWVGIDGFTNSSLIQTGTEQDYYNGAPHYAAWWTTSAQNFAEQAISKLVLAGDQISAAISSAGASSSSWTITLSDTTQGWTFSIPVTYTGPGASAEWIMEAPTVGGRIAPLAHYASPTTFDPGTANGASPGLVASEGGELVQGHGRNAQALSTPSGPDADVDGFNISYGSIAPPVPAS